VLEEGFGYVRIAQFQESTSGDLEKALEELGSKKGELKGLVIDLRNNPGGLLQQAVAVSNKKGLVIDLRNNPGGLLQQAVAVSNKFLKSGVIVSTKGRARGQDIEFDAKRAGTHSGFPVIIIVNGGSASGQCQRLRDSRRRTAGPQQGRSARHPHLWQGLRADHNPTCRRLCRKAHHEQVLYTFGQVHTGQGYRAGWERR
jgi:hypothetical protein